MRLWTRLLLAIGIVAACSVDTQSQVNPVYRQDPVTGNATQQQQITVPSGFQIEVQSGASLICDAGASCATTGGNVFNSGTPTVGQLAAWVDATHILGLSVTGSGNTLQSNGGAFVLNGNTGELDLQAAGSIVAKVIPTGLFPLSDNNFNLGNSSGAWALVATYEIFFKGATSGTQILIPNATTSGTLTLPAGTDTLVGQASFGTNVFTAIGRAQDGSNASAVGYLGVPQNIQSTNYTLVLGDSGKQIFGTTGANTWTIPANASVAFPVGTTVVFINTSASAATIAITSDTLTLAGTATTGSRTLATNGVATAVKVDSTHWIISGQGLS